MEVVSQAFERELERLRVAETPTFLVIPEREPPAVASIALLSGSFDPMTVAHAALAERAATHVDLVLLVYSARMLPKEGGAPPALLRETERLQVLERFCLSHPKTAVALCSHGLLAQQVAAARQTFANQPLYLVMGSDKVLQVLDARWYEDRDHALEGLFREAAVLYAERAGEEGLVGAALGLRHNVQWRDRFTRLDVPAEVAPISSRSVRAMIAAGQDASGVVVPEAGPYLPPIAFSGEGGIPSRK